MRWRIKYDSALSKIFLYRQLIRITSFLIAQTAHFHASYAIAHSRVCPLQRIAIIMCKAKLTLLQSQRTGVTTDSPVIDPLIYDRTTLIRFWLLRSATLKRNFIALDTSASGARSCFVTNFTTSSSIRKSPHAPQATNATSLRRRFTTCALTYTRKPFYDMSKHSCHHEQAQIRP